MRHAAPLVGRNASAATRRTVMRSRKLFDSMIKRRLSLALHERLAAAIEHKHLKRFEFRHVLDVGANRGQFALLISDLFPDSRIDCFEPIPSCVDSLRANLGLDSGAIHEFAVSDHEGRASFNISFAEDSSSLLEIGSEQTSRFPGTGQRTTMTVDCVTLDHWAEGRNLARPTLLKIDVQGSEMQVLAGAADLLASLDYVYAEVSFIELYVGQVLATDIIAFLLEHGFELEGVYNTKYGDHAEAIQADVMFRRRS